MFMPFYILQVILFESPLYASPPLEAVSQTHARPCVTSDTIATTITIIIITITITIIDTINYYNYH